MSEPILEDTQQELTTLSSMDATGAEEGVTPTEDNNNSSATADANAPFGGSSNPFGQQQGAVVAVRHDPVGDDDEEVCGICLEAPGPGKLATLWCCRNVLCITDAQMVGACPFCREEPLVWQLNHGH